MPTANSQKSARTGLWLLGLFGVPFAAVGVGMTWSCLHMVLLNENMRSWVEVPAVVKRVDLNKYRSSKSTTYQTVAAYDYEYEGKKFTGDRVTLGGSSDNIGSFQNDSYRELQQHLGPRKSFRCYINPQDPAQAVLYRDLRGEMLAFNTVFATLFGTIGLGVIAVAVVAARQLPKASIDPVPPDQPWLVREDWAAGVIRGISGAFTVPIMMAAALYWNIASLPLLYELPEIWRTGGNWKWAALTFPIIGAALLGVLIRQILQARRFGESVFQMSQTPGVIGGQLAGVVRIPKLVEPAEGFQLKLNCFTYTTGANNKKYEHVSWQDEELTMQAMHDNGADQTAVPVLFAIPYSAIETSQPGLANGARWRLDIRAKMPGVDYSSQFDVPVFRTAESRADFKLDPKLATDFIAPVNSDLPLREAGIGRESLADGGVMFEFPAAPNWPIAIIYTLFASLASVALYVLWPTKGAGMPPWAAVIFGLVDFALVWATLDLWLYRSTVRVSATELVVQGGLFGIGRARTFAANDIQTFRADDYMSSGATVWKNIVVVLTNGRKRTIGKGVSGTLAKRTIVDELTAALHSRGAL